MERSDIIQMGLMYGSFAVVFVILQYIPKQYSFVAIFLLFLPLILMIFYEWKVRVDYAKYKVLEMIVRAENDFKKKIFIDTWNSVLIQKASAPVYRTELIIKPTKYKEFGKINKIFLIHEGEFLKRVKFSTQTITVDGYTIPHPNVDYVVVYECEEPYFDQNEGQFYPVFVLERAGGDYRQMYYKYAEENEINDPNILKQKIKYLRTQIEGLRGKVSKLTEDNIRLKAEVKELTDSVKGLLDASKKKADTAKRFIIDVLNRHATIEAAAREVGARGENMWLYILAIVVIGGVFALFALRPEYAQSLGQWLSQGNNQLFLLIVIVAIVLIFALTKTKKR